MKKVLLTLAIVISMAFTGCVSMNVTDQELANFDGNSWIQKNYDNFSRKTTYSTGIGFMYEIENPLEPNTFAGTGIKLYKVISDDGKLKTTFADFTITNDDWMYAYKIIFLFDGVPYTINLEQEQTYVTDYAGVKTNERYTFDVTDEFLNKYINATTIDWKMYTKDQGTFRSYKVLDKSIEETKNFYKESDISLTEFMKK